jgi:hypothetical protein
MSCPTVSVALHRFCRAFDEVRNFLRPAKLHQPDGFANDTPSDPRSARGCATGPDLRRVIRHLVVIHLPMAQLAPNADRTFTGRKEETKACLYRQIVDNLRGTGLITGRIDISLDERPRDAWAIRDGTMAGRMQFPYPIEV